MQQKNDIRRQLRRRRINIGAAQRRQAQTQVCRALKPWLRRGKKIGFYLAVGSELDLGGIVQDALRRGCRLYVPYIEAHSRRLWFTPYPPSQTRAKCVFGIPQYNGRKCRIENLDMVLLPLVGIDAHGIRMGQGGGFYDTSLSFCRSRKPLTVGIGFACQQCDALPVEAHDEAVDAFVCENGVRCFSARASAMQPFL